MRKSFQNIVPAFVVILPAIFFVLHISGRSVYPAVAAAALDSQTGMVVEKVTKNQGGGRAQLQEGDIVQSWWHGDAHGTFDSPFDWLKAELEQGSVQSVVLKGLRGQEAREWTMPMGEWGVQVRPVLPAELLRLYNESRQLAQAGHRQEAVSRWRAAVASVDANHPGWLRPWILLRAAETLSGPDTWPEAANFYQEAAEQATGAGPEIEGWVSRSWGNALAQRRDWSGSDERYRKASSLQLAEDSLEVAADLNGLGAGAYGRRDYDKAEQYFSRAMAIQQRLAPQGPGMADSLTGLANIAQRRNNLDAGERLHQQALALLRRLGPDGTRVAASLAGLGNIAYTRGELDQADQFYLQALEINSGENGDRMGAAGNLNNLAIVAEQRGDLSQAEKRYREALAIKKKMAPGSLEVATGMHNLGMIVFDQGDWEHAVEFFEHSLAIFEQQAPDSIYIASSLHVLTMVALQKGDPKQAEEYSKRSLMIRQRIVPGSLDVTSSLNDLGNAKLDQGDLPAAEKYFLAALELEQKIAPGRLDVAETFNSLGDVAWKGRDLAKAEDYYRRAEAIREKLAPGSTILAESLADLAGVLRQEQRPQEAMELFQHALDALESQTERLGGSDAVRSSFRAKRAAYYKDYIDLLVQQGKSELAFKVLERFRARTLLEMLAVARVDVQQGVEPGLLEREARLQRDIKKESDARIRLLEEKHTEEQVKAAGAKAAALLAQYEDIRNQIRSASPAYAALTQPQPLGADEVQTQLLDQDTLLLEYSLGEERSYLFLVSKDSLQAVELPGRARIENAARGLYDLLTQRKQALHGEASAKREDRPIAGEREFTRQAARLSRMVLGKAASQLANKRLLVVADGALAYIPFAVLREPVTSVSGMRASAPLVARHEIVNLPSASVIAVLRRQAIGRPRPAKAVAVLADPVFDRDDPRVIRKDGAGGIGTAKAATQDRGDHAAPDEALSRSAEDLGLARGTRLNLPRLRFTRQEAEAIVATEPKALTMEALDFKATRAVAVSPELGQYQVVHFATHGFLDSKHPEFSGLVLSLVDKYGKPQMGFLGLEDIYNLKLNADLVVLSACETGLGKEISGEGLVGLTRGFMYAGASRVMASLWKVSDAATAQLMAEFYRAMAKDGLPPAAALRQAQLQMLKQKRWKSPYYWAAFQVQGEWK